MRTRAGIRDDRHHVRSFPGPAASEADASDGSEESSIRPE